MNDFVNELCKVVAEEGYHYDYLIDQGECLFCGLTKRGSITDHEDGCIVGRAEKYLRDNTWK